MGTVFNNKLSKEGQPQSLKTWIDQIRTGRWQKEVEAARLLVANGKPDQAKAIKADLPMFVCTATCTGGRLPKFITDRTQVAMLDYDRHDPDWAKATLLQVKEDPSVVAAYVTFSGGLRLFVNVGPVDLDDWKAIYTLTADYFDDELDVKCDRSCSDILRGTFPSFDPNAWYRDLEDTSVVPYADAFQQYMADLQKQISPMLAESNHPAGAPFGIDDILDRFFSKPNHQLVEGSRNSTVFTLGTWARFFHIQPYQLDEFIQRAIPRCVQPGFPENEIRQAIRNGYNKGTEGPEYRPNYAPSAAPVQPLEVPNLVYGVRCIPSTVQKAPQRAVRQNDKPEVEDVDEDELIEETCPTLPDEIFDKMPRIIRRALKSARTRRERDMLLLAIITNLSGCLPKVRVNYADRIYSAHLYFAAVSAAGSGKGIITLAARLGSKVNRLMNDHYQKLKNKYKHELLAWANEQKSAFKDHREVNWDLEPTEPKRQLLLFPPNTSKSQLIIDLEASLHVGMIMNTSEIDALAAALNTDYGQHTSELRMIFHHEQVGLNYKTDGRMVVVPHPRMAICISGTPEQLVNLIGNIEDGTYSRFLFLTAPSINTWISAEPNQSINSADDVFDELAEEVNDIFNYFNGEQEYNITFSHEQWERHSAVFGSLLDQVVVENENSAKAIVGRHGLSAIRMATVFSALRIFEDQQHFSPYTCTDEDFDIVLQISKVLIQHSKQLSTVIPRLTKRKSMTRFDKLKYILRGLPEYFTYTDFVNRAMEQGNSISWGKKGINKLLKERYIDKTPKGYKKLR